MGTYELIDCTLKDCKEGDYFLPENGRLMSKLKKKFSNGNVTVITCCHFPLLADTIVLREDTPCWRLVISNAMLPPIHL